MNALALAWTGVLVNLLVWTIVLGALAVLVIAVVEGVRVRREDARTADAVAVLRGARAACDGARRAEDTARRLAADERTAYAHADTLAWRARRAQL